MARKVGILAGASKHLLHVTSCSLSLRDEQPNSSTLFRLVEALIADPEIFIDGHIHEHCEGDEIREISEIDCYFIGVKSVQREREREGGVVKLLQITKRSIRIPQKQVRRLSPRQRNDWLNALIIQRNLRIFCAFACWRRSRAHVIGA